jgi:Fur family peroxide stress response transcriptional regulator
MSIFARQKKRLTENSCIRGLFVDGFLPKVSFVGQSCFLLNPEMMEMIESSVQTLQKAGLRITPQRLAVYRLLAGTDRHPTAQMIYEALREEYPSLSLATVYNTLDALVEAGVINALGAAGDGSIHYDADTSPHVNLACISCHRVIDLPSAHVSSLEEEVAAESGYLLLGARVMYYGLCLECQKKRKEMTD